MTKSAGYVSADYLRKVATLGQQIKQRSYELMAVTPGDQLLDVGCGPGIDTVALGKLVGPTGRVVGIDIDEEMLQQADALPFVDNLFDACHAERLFQVLPSNYNRHELFAEMLRVVRPGGRIVVADSDWATASVDYSDAALERRLMSFFASQLRPNGYAGRQLYAMYQQQSMADIQIEAFPLLQRDLTQSPFGSWLTSEALTAGIASAAELHDWSHELTTRHERGQFYWSVNLVVVAGIKR